MGIFDFLKSDKKKAHEAADKTKEQLEQQAAATSAPAAGSPSAMGGKYVDAAEATKAAAERMAASAPPKPVTHTPTPGSAAHKSVPAAPEPPATHSRPAPPQAMHAPHTPTPGSAAHKSVPAAPTKPAPAAKKRTYTVKSGDSLSAIARRELGNEARWRELYAMNRGVVGSNPDLIRPGMVLTLPN
ncbi:MULTISPECIES: LysM peptidoglycan-binding domain-containing protein [unclassified Streptomyces]|uniref:LysM peptidoglycan-binding domain-containing protein n=1 Tax=unclassified Streptomyces TaxID=2593676 RepID=UPI0022572FFE|nr:MULTISPECIES: LysM peptidoglycan-binding domain-containing protein [unclassified Streptomyces]MCX4526866.1 LysM peptidoglycan-binding domain-containing protein [Streptomyces sp. NBC_01551]MCX4542574.1 LysM peptidoglycan-binding domain-containing protein [Streptomyces sp. NBC_01565]